MKQISDFQKFSIQRAIILIILICHKFVIILMNCY